MDAKDAIKCAKDATMNVKDATVSEETIQLRVTHNMNFVMVSCHPQKENFMTVPNFVSPAE